ncbi:MAG: rod shape-determining protein MreC [Actinomycetota bacterium]
MVTTYRRVRSTRLLVVGLLVASLVTITIDARGGREGPMATIGRAFGAVIGPLQEGVAAVVRPVGSFVGNVFRSGTLAQENEALREQLALSRRQQSEVNSLRRENEELQRLLGLSGRLGFETMGATVTGEAPGNFEWAVIIDRGSVDGVTVDMPVIAGEGLVGRVVEVYQGSAKVMLIIDPDSAVSVRLDASGERGLLVGQREEPLQFRLIDQDTQIQPGETVETSGYALEEGLEGVFPPSIPVGVVDLVEPDESNLTLQVLVRPNVDFSRLSIVALVTGRRPLDVTTPSPPPTDEESPAG